MRKFEELDKVQGPYNKSTGYITRKLEIGGNLVIQYIRSLAANLKVKPSDIIKELGFDGIVDGDYIVAYSNDQIKMIEWQPANVFFESLTESLDISKSCVSSKKFLAFPG